VFIGQVALVSEVEQVTCGQLNKVSAALQKQVIRDFRPLWHINATVDPFESMEDIPLGYWPVIIVADVKGAAGVHLDRNGQPFALVEYGQGWWSLTASHETLEMLADPWGNRLIAGNSPKPDQGRVEFLVEVADPPEAPQFGYTVNGILLTDFLTPSFWDPVAANGVRYECCGRRTGSLGRVRSRPHGEPTVWAAEVPASPCAWALSRRKHQLQDCSWRGAWPGSRFG